MRVVADQSPWMNRGEAAEYLGFTTDQLAMYASRGIGPPYYKVTNRTVRYHVTDLDEWMRTHERR